MNASCKTENLGVHPPTSIKARGPLSNYSDIGGQLHVSYIFSLTLAILKASSEDRAGATFTNMGVQRPRTPLMSMNMPRIDQRNQ